jgi:hypothetical protein
MIDFVNNVDLTNKYLVCLRDSLRTGWKAYYENLCEFENQEVYILGKLALLHPEHYKKLKPNIDKNSFALAQERIQGTRTFNYSFNRQNCTSKDLWGYDCPLHNEPLVWDHDFPYSFGGATDNANNKRLLCRWHNMIKGNDIHIYKWEKLFDDYQYRNNQGSIHWIDLQIEKIKKEFNP